MSRKTTDYIIMHCTATKPSQNIGFEEVNFWHLARGWMGCGYHFIIKRDGIIEDGSETGGLTGDRSAGVKCVRRIRTDPRPEMAVYPVSLGARCHSKPVCASVCPG